MPWIRKGKSVYKKRSDGTAGALVSSHSSAAEATRNVKARYASYKPKPKAAGRPKRPSRRGGYA